MTLTELQNKLGEQIELLTDKETPHATKKALAETSIVVSSLAKQMINNADVVLRTWSIHDHQGTASNTQYHFWV